MNLALEKLLDEVTKEAREWVALEKAMRDAAKKYAAPGMRRSGKGRKTPDFDGRIFKSALSKVREWNGYADTYGEEPADALEAALVEFVARLDERGKKPARPPQTRGPKGADTDTRALMKAATTEVEKLHKKLGTGITRREADKIVREYFRKNGLLATRSAPAHVARRR